MNMGREVCRRLREADNQLFGVKMGTSRRRTSNTCFWPTDTNPEVDRIDQWAPEGNHVPKASERASTWENPPQFVKSRHQKFVRFGRHYGFEASDSIRLDRSRRRR